MSKYILALSCLISYLSYISDIWALPLIFSLSILSIYSVCLSFSVMLSVFILTSLTLTCYLSWPVLAGEHGSACHGSVLQGQFEGTIHTDNGSYHIEPVHRYDSSPTDHHSIIYHEDDIGKTTFSFFTLGRRKLLGKCCLSTHFQAAID